MVEKVTAYWLERWLEEMDRPCLLPDLMPSGSGICIVTKGSQLFNAELQKDSTTMEVQ